MNVRKMSMTGMLVGTLVLGASWTLAEDDPYEGYTRTGEMTNCIQPNRIKNTRVLDDQHILFDMVGSQYYINELPNKCNSLGVYKAFSYQLRGSSLCSMDSIKVYTNSPAAGSTCGLGEFEEVTKDK